MLDSIRFFANIARSFTEIPDYCKRGLEEIAAENGEFSYIDNRKNHYLPIVQTLSELFGSSCKYELLRYIITQFQPSRVGVITSLFPESFQEKPWKKFKDKLCNIETEQCANELDYAIDKIGGVLQNYQQGTETENDRMILSGLLSISTLKSKSSVFPDFMFKIDSNEQGFSDGSVLELKDSKGQNIASFNSTIPTHFKKLSEIDMLNGKTIVSRLSKIIDFPDSSSPNYMDYERRCFYLVRTHKDKRKVKISIIEGSFFETLPKDRLIAETMKTIAREHLGTDISHEMLQLLEQINDQAKIAKSQPDIQAVINGRMKRASVRPRFRIMTEVTKDGNPHSYDQIPERTLNLVLRIVPSRNRDDNYRERKNELIRLLRTCLSDVFGSHFRYDENNEELSNGTFFLKIKEIEHRRNGIHIVFQFGFP